MAPDQRYCIECGQRRGPVQLPFLDQAALRTRQASAQGKQRRHPAMSVNTTLIAGIGTLMLAMGTGVLIGRSAGSGSGKAGAVQVLTVPSAGGTSHTGSPVTGTGAVETQSSTRTRAEEGASSGSGGGAKSKTKAGKASVLAKQAPTKLPKAEKAVVTVGSKGKGPGYQKGKFTGHFFGEEGEEEEESEEAHGKGRG